MSKLKSLGSLYARKRVIEAWKNSILIYSVLACCILIATEIYPKGSFLKEYLFSTKGYALVLFATINTYASFRILKLVKRISDGSFISIAAAVFTVVGPEYIPLFGELLLSLIIENHMRHVCLSMICSFLLWKGVNQKIGKFLLIYGKETEEELLHTKRTAKREGNA